MRSCRASRRDVAKSRFSDKIRLGVTPIAAADSIFQRSREKRFFKELNNVRLELPFFDDSDQTMGSGLRHGQKTGGLAGERGRERFASSAAPAGHDGAITNVRWPSASSRAGGSRPRSLVMVVEKLERFLKELKIVGMRAPRCQGEFSKRRG